MTEAAAIEGLEAYDQLATMVALARADGHCLYANTTLEAPGCRRSSPQ